MAHVSDIRTSGTSITARFTELRNALFARYTQYRNYRTTLVELDSLSDRELNDLGLSRSTIKSVALESVYI